MSAIFAYICKGGHAQTSPKPLASCQGFTCGVRCMGELRRVGKGSRPRQEGASK